MIGVARTGGGGTDRRTGDSAFTERPKLHVPVPLRRDLPIVVELAARPDLADARAMPRAAARRQVVWERLVQTAAATQEPLLRQVADLASRGLVRDVQRMASPNALVVTPAWGRTEQVADALRSSEIKAIWRALNGRELRPAGVLDAADGPYRVEPWPAVVGQGRHQIRGSTRRATGSEAVSWNQELVGAHHAWAQGADGRGTVLGVIDSGVNSRHPELREGYRGHAPDGTTDHRYNWMDFSRVRQGFPTDLNGHGTAVTAVAVGKTSGIAPGARWIGVKAGRIGDVTPRLSALQWMLAPTDLEGRAPRPDLAPDVLGISWNSGSPRERLFEASMRNLEDAGIVVVKAAGNNGPDGEITSPGQFREVLTVGAVDRTGASAVFSSPGPSPLPPLPGERLVMKPDLMGPGVKVLTAAPHLPWRRHVTTSGTSFAQPHVAGASLIVLGDEPRLDGRQVDDILRASARDLGRPGPDTTFGAGLLDIPAALRLARATPFA